MIYFFYGTDTDKARNKAHELVESLRKKKSEAGFFKLDADNFDPSSLEEYIGGQGLFSNKYIVLLDRLCENKEVKEDFISSVKEVGLSDNIFIVLEGKLDKASATKIEKNSTKTLKCDLPEESRSKFKEENNAFALANAFGARNKKETWLLYRKAINAGEAPEALHGMLFWKVKTMLLSDGSGWREDELMVVMDKLVTIYHDSRRGVHELETGLETMLLDIK